MFYHLSILLSVNLYRLLLEFQARRNLKNVRLSLRAQSELNVCTIPKVSISSIEPGIQVITDLDYGWLSFFLNKTSTSINILQCILFL